MEDIHYITVNDLKSINDIIGAKVVFANDAKHKKDPYCYPPNGTIGCVVDVCRFSDSIVVDWEDGSTSGDGRWRCDSHDVAILRLAYKAENSWIEKLGYGGWGDIYWECGSCYKEFSFKEGTPLQNDFYFCPKCGAKKANVLRVGEDRDFVGTLKEDFLMKICEIFEKSRTGESLEDESK